MSHLNRVAAQWAMVTVSLGIGAHAAAQAGAEPTDAQPSVAQNCLNHSSIRRTKILNDKGILFVTRGGQHYHNPLPKECPSLNRNSVVNYGIVSDRVCAGSSFQVLWRVGMDLTPTFLCQLGMFVPISADEAVDLLALTDPTPEGRKQRRRSSRDMVTTTPIATPPSETAGTPTAPPTAGTD